MRLIYFGDSHAHALLRAKVKFGVGQDLTAVDIRRVGNPNENSKEIHSGLAKTFPADAVFCCLGGTEYNLLGLIESEVPYDFLVCENDSVLPDRQIIPNGTVKAALIARMRSSRHRTELVREQFDCPFVCVAPPPPFSTLEGTEKFPIAFASLIERGITPPSVRRKWYELQIELLKAECETAGIGFMPAPADVRDASGFLLRKFWDSDPTHGNAEYGRLVIEQIEALHNG